MDVVIITRNHAFDRTDIPMMEQGVQEESPVVIGNDVWIGERVIILPWVTVGDRSILAAGVVITHDVPAYSIVAEIPGRVIKTR